MLLVSFRNVALFEIDRLHFFNVISNNNTYITSDKIVCKVIAYVGREFAGTWHSWQPWHQRLIGCSSQNALQKLAGRTGFVTNSLRSRRLCRVSFHSKCRPIGAR